MAGGMGKKNVSSKNIEHGPMYWQILCKESASVSSVFTSVDIVHFYSRTQLTWPSRFHRTREGRTLADNFPYMAAFLDWTELHRWKSMSPYKH